MASPAKAVEKKERSLEGGEAPVKTPENKEHLPTARGEIVGALSEGVEVGGESVSEVASERREGTGSGMPASGKGDDQGAASFTFDETNLPPAPEMIQKIERQLRSEIRHLQKQARYHQGSLFRKPDFPRYSETMIEIRKKNVLLKRLFSFAAEALKKLFLQMFGAKKA